MKAATILILLIAFILGILNGAKSANWLSVSKIELLKLRGAVYENKKADLIFLLDTSGSLSNTEFGQEKKFITNLLNEISVGFEATRVEVIPFGHRAYRFIKFISDPGRTKNKCYFNERFNPLRHENGWATNTKQAFEKAYDVCLGQYSGQKRQPMIRFKTVIILLTDGYWNYPYGASDPIPKAQELVRNGAEVMAIGVGYNIHFQNLQRLVANQKGGRDYAFHLRNFNEFNELATYIRGDPFETVWQVTDVPGSKCKPACDQRAECACGLVYGDYKCACPPGYAGSGANGDCNKCPKNTYKDFKGHADTCTQCPGNSEHNLIGSTSILHCKCKDGFEGQPHLGKSCTVRRCPKLVAPKKGKITGGACNREFGNQCTVTCEQGFELKGSATRRCVFFKNSNRVDWDGTPAQCPVVTCSGVTVNHAVVPGGNCVLPDNSPSTSYEYSTICTYKCSRGYRYTGDLVRKCQVNGQWSGTKPTCTEVRCENLPSVALGYYSPQDLECATKSNKFDTVCTHHCPAGYHMHPGNIVDTTNSRKCDHVTGAWDGAQRTCKDHLPSELTCPSKDLEINNDKGEKTANTTWSFDFNDNSLREGASTKDSFTVVLLINNKEVSPVLPKTLELGRNRITYNVTDPDGNSQTCSFSITVVDNEPPTCSSCPGDITEDSLTTDTYRPNWVSPVCTDNSGIPPSIRPSRRKGDSLIVPGTYPVKYFVSDQAGNEYHNCSFVVKLIKPQCKQFAPPRNGAAACFNFMQSMNCQVSCRNGYDFVFLPALSYFCSNAKWDSFGFPPYNSKKLPWPDCSKRENPGAAQLVGLPQFYFEGDCTDPNVVTQITTNFLGLMKSGMVPPIFCMTNPNCNAKNVAVYCGATDAVMRRRKRANTKRVSFKIVYVEKSDSIQAGSDDDSNQQKFNQLKNKVEKERAAIYAGLERIDWGGFKVTSGLDLRGGAPSFNLKNVEAFCSEEGAVVRKCSKSQLATNKCDKQAGDVTKCVRCPIGTYYNSDKEKCLVCPEGQYVNKEGALQCYACPKGTWTFGAQKENFTSCQAECGPGYFSHTGIARCFACPAGAYSSERRNTKCITCPAGTTTVAGASKALEDCGMQCAPGTYSHNGVESCQPCPAGTYQNGTGHISCLPCPGRLSTYGSGADSVQSCVEVNDCPSSPCNNNGRCIDTKESYRCVCPPGYRGVNCEHEVDECAKKPCFRGATCVNRVNGYVCLCPPGFFGASCDKPIKTCQSQNPCVRGECVEKGGGAQCECPTGYEGDFCELNADECASNPCQNNAVCIGGLNQFQCVCKSGYSGKLCQINDDDCSADPCRNGGKCVDGERSFSCLCVPGYTGATCEYEIMECQSAPCQHGGRCIEMFNGYKCSCSPTYTGRNCEKQLSSDYDLSFQDSVTKPYARTIKDIPDMTDVTIAFWLRTEDDKPGTPFSYAVRDGNIVQDNALTLQDLGGLNLFVNNRTVFIGVIADDGYWHHLAVTWQSTSGAWKAYLDGARVKSSTDPFQQHQIIRGGGIMIVGQEQDKLGGGFNAQESYSGDLSQLNVWKRVLSDNEIYNLAQSCAHTQGDVIAWADFREGLSGVYSITPTSYACQFSSVRRYVTTINNASIPSFNNRIISSSSPESCAQMCDRETSFVCRSFDYDKKTKTCYLSVKHSGNNLVSYDTTARYDYYEMNCLKSVGVGSRRLIPDSSMMASSEWDSKHAPKGARLNNPVLRNDQGVLVQVGAWCARSNDRNQWLQVKLPRVMRVSGVATQGREDADQWVTQYKIQFHDGSRWTDYSKTFGGNNDRNTVVRHELQVLNALYVRFLPVSWHSHISMRVEVYGCPLRKVIHKDTTNECASNPCSNGAVCANRLGSYLCLCTRGYSGQRCQTRLPCGDPGTPIYGTKSSTRYTAGSTISFSCRAGFAPSGSSSRRCNNGEWTGTQPTCEDVNECNGHHGCAQLCRNTHGSFHCACARGYRASGKQCIDINECATNNGGCSHSCHNTQGGVKCLCPSGLVLSNGKRTCVDVNECARSKGGCQHACVNTHRSFKCLCNRGFSLNSNGKNCDPLSCPALPSISQGRVQTSSNLVGAIATYTCNGGYRVIGPKARECQPDTTWSGKNPTCTRVYCREVGTIKNAARSLIGFSGGRPVVGSSARFTCNAHHVMQGSRDLVCKQDGTWSGDLPRCIPAFCANLAAPGNGQVQGFRFELGATLRVTCNAGYNLKPAASSFRTCVRTSGGGKWSAQDPVCELVDCGDPGNPYGGFRTISGGTKYQAVARFTCKAQHHLQGKPTQVCQADGKWSGIKPVCLERSCGYLDPPTNGKKNSDGHQYGQSVAFTCNTGYRLVGSAKRTCQNNGIWTGSQPTCQIVSCGNPGTPANGLRFGDKLTYQSVLAFECAPGYRLAGTIYRRCQANGQWSGNQPTCTATSCGRLRVGPSGIIQSQNFPSNYRNNDYCTWEIRVPVNKKVRLDFEEFKTEVGKDLLIIYDTGKHQPTLYYDGSSNIPPPFTSSGHSIRIRFITDEQTTMKGFKLRYKQVDPSCGGTLTASTGSFMSPNYPNMYANNLDCVWLIARPGEKIEMTFLQFDTEPNYDAAYIYQGKYMSKESVIVQGWSGLGTPTYPFVASDFIWIRFKTNYITTDGVHKGFQAEYYKYNPYQKKK